MKKEGASGVFIFFASGNGRYLFQIGTRFTQSEFFMHEGGKHAGEASLETLVQENILENTLGIDFIYYS